MEFHYYKISQKPICRYWTYHESYMVNSTFHCRVKCHRFNVFGYAITIKRKAKYYTEQEFRVLAGKTNVDDRGDSLDDAQSLSDAEYTQWLNDMKTKYNQNIEGLL
jgi:hypothetical protein